ncbi:TetR/AcrR family transcriptional regulator [Tessaracoccus palaemonis]|uniref:TetR/AcrR family transcriptional regulator n=1 Tax=Tessaracoccus palaemonis TaxID=2829499 RepID=A0ABX8SKU8_9ACTN|nr:TetR/AcrR family transcriptional regulator [Tessaracoccus palaemonis]QXT62608.1 TetR/AcrR family transcriptional regulator [Tessaracoccus palaemonis]
MSTQPRGPYAKGLARREEILVSALDVVARAGFHGASVKEIADEVGLSQAGLLHYFTSKDDLFVEVLRRRDERDNRTFENADDPVEALLEVVEHNASVPGLVELFSRMAVAAADPEHPAHDYFLERGTTLRASLAQALGSHSASAAGTSEATVVPDPETTARLLQAAADGLQLQFLQDPTVDMVAPLRALVDTLRRRP